MVPKLSPSREGRSSFTSRGFLACPPCSGPTVAGQRRTQTGLALHECAAIGCRQQSNESDWSHAKGRWADLFDGPV
jgi:hypothetical protein